MFIKPMRAKKDNTVGVPVGGYVYETKYDGIRAIMVWDRKTGMIIYSKSGADITRKFPEITNLPNLRKIMTCNKATFDAEIVCFKDGVPSFGAITSRFHLGSPEGWVHGMVSNPVTACLFDILSLDGQDVMSKSLMARKEILLGAIAGGPNYKVTRVHKDGEKLYQSEEARGAEGIIAKRVNSMYQPGRRLKDWLKVKIMYREEVVVYGFTAGLGKRDTQFGSLLFRGLDGRPAGKVGTGFTDAELIAMTEFLETREPVFQIDGRATETFLLDEPFNAVVEGMKKNKSGAIREPVYIGVIQHD